MSELLPELVNDSYQRRLNHFLQLPEQGQWLQELLADSNFAWQLATVWGCSDFVAQSCAQNPQQFLELAESGDLQRSYRDEQWPQKLRQMLLQDCSEEQLMAALRQFRRREMMRIVWRDFSGQAPLLETTRDMTLLAEAVINVALDILYPLACADWGTPFGRSGEQQHLLVIGMGKMGGYELNVSSDIDLIFAYPESGETRGGRKALSNQEFFIRLGQKLIRAIDQQTADGFVFRVDMRLRPYGQSGALALNFDALEEYYLTQGREWERYAMIKARVVAGPDDKRVELAGLLRPFTYRKYLDFGAIEALRDLKRNIEREVARKGLQDDVKRGAGGIREVEFIAQAFQVIRGGRDLRLQTQSLRQVIDLLAADQVMAPAELQQLWRAYEFLRDTEHAIQGIGDRQSQTLPGDNLGRQRIAFLLGCDSWERFTAQLAAHRALVKRLFGEVFSDTEQPAEQRSEQELELEDLWLNMPEREQLAERLAGGGFEDGTAAATHLDDLHNNKAVLAMQRGPRARLDALMPRLLAICASGEQPSESLIRSLGLVRAVLRRSAYLALLVENPDALRQLVSLCRGSSWVAAELAAYPALLDELLDPRTLYTPPDKAILRDDLRQQMLRVAPEDLEEQMEGVRYFCRAHKLRVAACDIAEVLPIMKVSDYLTWLAEAVMEHVIEIAWAQMAAKYGEPQNSDGSTPGFIAVGYGKLGGIELGYSSDLDLVFLHNAEPNRYTNGERSIDNSTFFMRLGQRIIHILSTQTPSGIAYEVDMRLRPSGNSGMLVATLPGFNKYQREDAWTWEHQALVRARVIAGDKTLAAQFDEVRSQILSQRRESDKLRDEVAAMREKMRNHLGGKAGEGQFALKQDRGGIVDIEFMVQFAVLAWSCDQPALTRWSDNIRILETLSQCGLLAEESSQQLIEAYKAYRAAGHRLQLQRLSAVVEERQFAAQRQQVITLWEQIFAGSELREER